MWSNGEPDAAALFHGNGVNGPENILCYLSGPMVDSLAPLN